jgi:hypothetical protein
MDAKCGRILDFGGYFIKLLFIADIHCTFHNFIIFYAMHIQDSGVILCFCRRILTVLNI